MVLITLNDSMALLNKTNSATVS